MAKSTTLQILARDTGGNDVQRSITYANPNASNYVLKTFAQKVNALTDNTFRGAVRIDKEDITNAMAYPYTVTPEQMSYTIGTGQTQAMITLNTTIDTDTEVTWSITPSTGLSTGQIRRTSGTTFTYVLAKGTTAAGTYTVEFYPMQDSEQVANSNTLTITVE